MTLALLVQKNRRRKLNIKITVGSSTTPRSSIVIILGTEESKPFSFCAYASVLAFALVRLC